MQSQKVGLAIHPRSHALNSLLKLLKMIMVYKLNEMPGVRILILHLIKACNIFAKAIKEFSCTGFSIHLFILLRMDVKRVGSKVFFF